MAITVSGEVTIVDESGQRLELDAEDFDVEFVSESERDMGREVIYEVSYDSGSYSLRKQISEYPMGSVDQEDEWKTENCEIEEGGLSVAIDYDEDL